MTERIETAERASFCSALGRLSSDVGHCEEGLFTPRDKASGAHWSCIERMGCPALARVRVPKGHVTTTGQGRSMSGLEAAGLAVNDDEYVMRSASGRVCRIAQPDWRRCGAWGLAPARGFAGRAVVLDHGHVR